MIACSSGEADLWNGEPDVCGATVYRGILGYGAKGHKHRPSRLHLQQDLPIMISILERTEDSEERILEKWSRSSRK